MLTLAQVTAILSLLMAFGVDTITINQVHDILIPPTVSTTSVVFVPVVQTPIIPNAPVYFGSTQATVVNPPVNNPPPVVVAPVVPKWDIRVTTEDNKGMVAPLTVQAGTGMLKLLVEVFNKDGVYQYVPVTITTNDPDLPPSFIINNPDKTLNTANFFCVAPNETGGNGCPAIHPVSVGTFDVTFTVEDVSVTKHVTVTQ